MTEKITGIISHVVDDNSFYIVDDKRLKTLKEIGENVKNCGDLETMFYFPQNNDRFLINTVEDGLQRIRRLPFKSTEKMLTQFEDTGEIFTIALKDFDINLFFITPDEMSKVPALAVKCKLNGIKIEALDNENFLERNIFNKFVFEVVRKTRDAMIVDVVEMPHAAKKLTFTQKEIDVFYEEPLNTENALIAAQGNFGH
jgi:hypothetical protein